MFHLPAQSPDLKPPLILPPQIEAMVSRIDSASARAVLAYSKPGVIVYHRLSRTYYSTAVLDPWAFIKRMDKTNATHGTLALSLRRMLARDTAVDVLYMHPSLRTSVENALQAQGLVRMATGRGEMQDEQSHLFSVTNPVSMVTRYVCAPKDTPEHKIKSEAEKSMVNFLSGSSDKDRTLRERVKPVVGWGIFKRPAIFVENTRVLDTGPIRAGNKDYSAYVRQKNLQSMTERVGLKTSY